MIAQASAVVVFGVFPVGDLLVNARGGQANNVTKTARPNSEYIVVKAHGSSSRNSAL
jgi:hypothetical protein